MNDTGDTGANPCEIKIEEYETKADEYYAAIELFYQKKADAERLYELYESDKVEAFSTLDKWNEANATLEAAKEGGNPNQSRIDEINQRLSEIALYGDIEARLEELQPILTGDDLSGNVDDAWSETNLLIALLQEKAELEAEKETLSEWDLSDLEEDAKQAEAEHLAADAKKKTAWIEYNAAENEATILGEESNIKRNYAQNAYDRYYDYQCDEEYGDLEELEPLNQ